MGKYRKKPVVVEAHQWFKNGDHPFDGVPRFMETSTEGKVVRYFNHPQVPGGTPCKHCAKPHNVHGWIATLEGGHIVCPGDYIITGTAGERYPCKASIFNDIYEPADA